MTRKPGTTQSRKATRRKIAKRKTSPIVEPTGYRHLQVRLSAADARRFKRAAEDRGLNLHAGLIEAINAVLDEWGEDPVSDEGSAGKASSD